MLLLVGGVPNPSQRLGVGGGGVIMLHTETNEATFERCSEEPDEQRQVAQLKGSKWWECLCWRK